MFGGARERNTQKPSSLMPDHMYAGFGSRTIGHSLYPILPIFINRWRPDKTKGSFSASLKASTRYPARRPRFRTRLSDRVGIPIRRSI